MIEYAFPPEVLAKLQTAHKALGASVHLQKYNKFIQFKAYPKQLQFFNEGLRYGQRMFNAGNRLGKSEAGAFETACHLTGDYPDWWTGHRFDHPIDAWAAGLSAVAVRDIMQAKLCGPANKPSEFGTGMVPLDKFEGSPVLGRGITGGYDTIFVKHKSGGISQLGFKSYEAGWQKFQGTAKDWIWLDEEPPDYMIYTECLTRTLDTGGKLIITYTPLSGENSEIWQAYQNSEDGDKVMVTMSAKEVMSYENSHIDPEKFAAMLASWPAHQRETRASGKPSAGAGAVFTMLRQDIECPPIHDPGGYCLLGWGVDFGGMGGSTLNYSHPFGAVLLAYDASHDCLYIIREVKLPGGQVLNHAGAMQRMCALAPVFWPHDGHRSTATDKTKDTRDLYKETGLKMWHTHATFKEGGYATEAGIMEMQARFETGRLKICQNLPQVWAEYGSYSRDEKGELIKVNDDLMSAIRIGVMMVPRFGRQVPMGGVAQLFTGRRQTQSYQAHGGDADLWNPAGD